MSGFWRIGLVAMLLSSLAYAQDATGSLSGPVTDETGAILVDVTVLLRSNALEREVHSDSTGTWTFVNLPSGQYQVAFFELAFRIPQVQTIELAAGEHKVLPSLALEVALAERPEPNSVRLLSPGTKTGSITGTVVVYDRASSTLRPLSSVTVSLLCFPARKCKTSKTGENGRFRFESLDPGTYQLVWLRDGYYEEHLSGLMVRSGLDEDYGSLPIERCVDKSCNPSKRPMGVSLFLE